MSEVLTPEEFDRHIARGTLRLAFIGMSNGGKSYRSKALHNEEGFAWYQVDQAILDELGFADMLAISSWLGYPMEEGYPERERRYLELEDRFTKNASMRSDGANLVFDTTGSIVHLPEETLAILQDNCLIIHLDVGDDSMAEMMRRFFEEPKPVAWFGHYAPRPGEDVHDSLRRSYPALLAERLARYRALAHVNIPARELWDASGSDTLRLIRSHLR